MSDPAGSVADYLLSVPPAHRDAMEKLRALIRERLPGPFEEKMQYGMISYVVPRALYPKGYHCAPTDDLAFLSLGSQKNHIALYHYGLYLMPDIRERFIARCLEATGKKPDMGKACIRFKRADAIPYGPLAALLGEISMESFIQRYEDILAARKK